MGHRYYFRASTLWSNVNIYMRVGTQATMTTIDLDIFRGAHVRINAKWHGCMQQGKGSAEASRADLRGD